MKRIKPSKSKPNSLTVDRGLADICDLLRGGDIAAIPTETVYGLAADSSNSTAIAKIFAAKGRPSFNPLIVHVMGTEQAQKLVHWNEMAQKLADTFWPGALTIILDAKSDNGIANNVSAGLSTLAIRCPAHPIIRALLAKTGLNLAAPSANRSGQLSATSADHVRKSFGDNAPMILDGGICDKGLESTIVAIRNSQDGSKQGWQILRPGPITTQMITDCLGTEALPNKADNGTGNEVSKIEAPGQLSSHYAPQKPLSLKVDVPKDDMFFIGLGDMICDYNLSLSSNLDEAAANLFAALHIGDNSLAASIAVTDIPMRGIGIAINDRLKRAAVKA